ncbi:helicase-associated domain-containing protein [Paenibacillus alkaliterrae]|uniref:helicase-associated domain-containing protein n=1 Tax=Paenibacillus alkaliterrae TaxID=320909 RepID=UPI001F3FEF52|nr:helicase-associated domain-containing protein [Paenibacillus alkaliterrae]MCF2936891.1 helicase-associated domain-containing protein [Paenibacillus alkaliterrae]
MNIQQLLGKLSEQREERFILADVWRPAMQRGLSWREAALDREAVQSAAERLSANALLVLKTMLRSFAAVPAQEERLITAVRKHTGLSGAECHMGLVELEEAGILFSVRKVWGEKIFFIPVDCFSIWQQSLWPFQTDPLSSANQEKLINGKIRTHCRPLGRQLLSAFAALAQSGLELTKKGALSKKTVAKLVQVVELDEQCLHRFGLKWTHRELYPLKAAFILEAGAAIGLLQSGEGALKWKEDSLTSWLELDEGSRERQLMDWCLRLLLPAGGASSHAAAALIGLEARLWYSERDVEEWLKKTRVETFMNADLNVRWPAPCWYELFHSLGWMELVDCCGSDGRERLFRWKGSYSAHARGSAAVEVNPHYITIQPNGELIVEPSCPFTIRWELELLAERVSDEQVAVYQLKPVTVARALENGRTNKSIQSFLMEASGSDSLPSAFEALMEVWTSRACRYSFAEAVLLRCDSEQMAELVEKDSEMAPMLLAKLGASDFMVDKSQLDEIRRLLQQAGYPPRKGVQSYPETDHKCYPFVKHLAKASRNSALTFTPEIKSADTFIYETCPLHHFELTDGSASESMQPFLQLEQVPAIWTKQLRSYHHSTRKELIEQALEWQTPVQLRIEQELRSFVPERIEQQNGTWAVVGLLRDEQERQLIRLTPDMWEEMRLVIPGLADPT